MQNAKKNQHKFRVVFLKFYWTNQYFPNKVRSFLRLTCIIGSFWLHSNTRREDKSCSRALSNHRYTPPHVYWHSIIHTYTHTHHSIPQEDLTGACRVRGGRVCTREQGRENGEPRSHWHSPSMSAGFCLNHVTLLPGCPHSSLWSCGRSDGQGCLLVYGLPLHLSEKK